ncbi:MAG: alternative ribosome rescue aminoacyl-tRNA hydrolase ArfB [Candidatus Neomarinimicrobiota bacterium]
MIKINNKISIFDEKIKYNAIKSSGPGGQHVNKVSTAIVLRYNIYIHGYPNWFIKNLISSINTKQLSKNGTVQIKSKKYKSQYKNKNDAFEKLINIFKKSSIKKKPRQMTHPPKKSKQKRLKNKLIQSNKKKLRKNPNFDD